MAVGYWVVRARRSVVDHSLGMGEAPGSNPGESTRLTSFVSFLRQPSQTSGSLGLGESTIDQILRGARLVGDPLYSCLRRSRVDVDPAATLVWQFDMVSLETD